MSSENQTCPCGLTGENCAQLVPPLKSFNLALNETCFEEGFERCRILSSEALCKCKCGWSGDFCEDRNEPIGINYIVGGVILPFMFLVLFFSMKSPCKKRNRKRTQQPPGRRRTSLQLGIYPEEIVNYDFKLLGRSNVSWVTPKLLLAYRIFALIAIVPALVITVLTEEHQYETFSVWNFTLLGVYFFLSAIASLLYICHFSKSPKPKKQNSEAASGDTEVEDINQSLDHLAKALNLNEQQKHEMMYGHSRAVVFLEREFGIFLHIIFVVELPSAIYIAITIWVAFLPQALENGDQDQILNVSSYFLHAVNVVLILGELYLNKFYLELRYGGYFYLWAVTYMTFHLALMYSNEQHDKDHCPFYYPLDLSQKVYPGWITILFTCAIGVFVVCYLLSEAKYKHFSKKHKRKSKRHSRMSLARYNKSNLNFEFVNPMNRIRDWERNY